MYGGVKRAPTAWNNYVKANYDSVRYLPVKERFAALSVMARKAGVIGNSLPRATSVCAKEPLRSDRADCVKHPLCAWREQSYTKSGKIRKGFCTKGTRSKSPRYTKQDKDKFTY